MARNVRTGEMPYAHAGARAAARTTRVSIPFCVAVVLLCLTLVSMHLTSGLFARYTSSVEYEDAARVAKFEVTPTMKLGESVFVEDFVVEVAPGTPAVYEATIVNGSEVAVTCAVKAVNKTGNIATLAFAYDNSGASSLAPGATGVCTLTVSWPKEGALQYMGMVDVVQVSIRVDQID